MQGRTAQLCQPRSPSSMHPMRPSKQRAAAHSHGQAAVQLAQPQVLSSIKELPLGKYKACLLDQFGVLHDGRKPYPGALEAVRQLHAAGLQLFIISNSSRRSTGTIAKLAKMGWQESWFAGAVTSGELAHGYLESRPGGWWQSLGTRVLHITWSTRGAIDLGGLGLQIVGTPEEADFILAHGTEAVAVPLHQQSQQHPQPGHDSAQHQDGHQQQKQKHQQEASQQVRVEERSVEQLCALLDQCAQAARARGRAMPLVCANPDLVTVDGGALVTMPGTLARHYQGRGGEVVLMGKPAPLIYEACLRQLGVPADQVLAIGDSLEHDIAGAAAAGIDCLFIAGGIHAAELLPGRSQGAAGNGGSCDWDQIGKDALQRLCGERAANPTYAVPFLSW